MTVEIRLATSDDAPGILAIYAPFCASSHVSFETVPPTEAAMRERIARITEQFPWLVCEIDGEIAGYVYASQHRERAAYRWAVDVAVYVADAHRRRSVGRALYTSLLALVRDLGYFQAYAGITLPNSGSVGLHQAMGFEQVAFFPNVGFKMGQWRDVGWWRLQLSPVVDDPKNPRPFRELHNSPSVYKALNEGMQRIRLARAT
jgi:phosphinothricin acetyltransferase